MRDGVEKEEVFKYSEQEVPDWIPVATPQYDKGKGDENEGNNHLFEDDAVVVIMILGKGRSQELFDK